MDLDAHTAPMNGFVQSLSVHSCFNKCSRDAPCLGDDCHCEGHYSGYDTPSSNAICGDVHLCKYLCDHVEGCKSIDFHGASGSRCFLNSNACDTHEDRVDKVSDSSYTLLIKTTDIVDDSHFLPGREEVPADVAGANGIDLGYSWDRMLRFQPVAIASGGTFKLCFCDSSLLDDGDYCTKSRHFTVEVGRIHASGLACLLTDTKLQRASCVAQFHGGLRCYHHYDAPSPPPPAGSYTEYDYGRSRIPDSELETWCVLAPEEDVSLDPRCQTSSGFHSTE